MIVLHICEHIFYSLPTLLQWCIYFLNLNNLGSLNWWIWIGIVCTLVFNLRKTGGLAKYCIFWPIKEIFVYKPHFVQFDKPVLSSTFVLVIHSISTSTIMLPVKNGSFFSFVFQYKWLLFSTSLHWCCCQLYILCRCPFFPT